MIRRVIADENLQIDWHGLDRQYMTVREWGTHRLLVDTFTGYWSSHLTDAQTSLLERYYAVHKQMPDSDGRTSKPKHEVVV